MVQTRFSQPSPELVAALRFLLLLAGQKTLNGDTEKGGQASRLSLARAGRPCSFVGQTNDSSGHLKTRKDFQGRITEMVLVHSSLTVRTKHSAKSFMPGVSGSVFLT